MRRTAPAAAIVLLLLSACATRPGSGGRDGPDARPPSGLERVPDAEPRVEPLRNAGPNKPYEILGRTYVPLATDLPLRESGGASWYGRKFHGRPTASGETYDMYAMTAAHKTMPIPSYARVRNPANGREVVLRINDRGPFADGRVIDLSYTAALKLGLLNGVAPVEVVRLTFEEIRSGRWRVAGAAVAAAIPPPLSTRPSPAGLLPDDPPPGEPLQSPSGASMRGWWLQLGAFRVRDSALQLQQRLQLPALDDAGGSAAPTIAVFDEDGLFRVQAGPWATRAQAQAAADKLRRQLGTAPLPLERH